MAATLQPPPIDTPQDGPDGLFSTVWQRFFISLRAISQLWTQQPFVTYKASTDLTSPQNLGLLATGFLKTTLTGAVATISSTASIPVSGGGTGDTTLTAHGVLIGEGASPVAVTAAGAAKTVLIGQGAADPIFSGSVEVASMIVDLALTADSPTLVVDSTNHFVGVGTATPAAKLHVKGEEIHLQTDSSFLSFQNTADVLRGYIQIIEGGEMDILQAQAFPMKFFTNNQMAVTILSGGNVGIGTITPSGKLHVFQGASGATAVAGLDQIVLENNTTGGMSILTPDANLGEVVFGTPSDNFGALFRWDFTGLAFSVGPAHAGASLIFWADNAAEYMRILTGGNVGIGTTNPTKLFSVAEKFQVSSAGLIPKYNNIATVNGGVPAEYATIDSTGLTANVTAATLYAVPASGEGMYRVSAYVVETVAGSVSSVLPNVQIIYTDKDSNVAVTIDATPILGAAGLGQTGALNANTGGTVSSGVIVIYVKASTTIQYQTLNYASVAAGMTYALRIRLELL